MGVEPISAAADMNPSQKTNVPIKLKQPPFGGCYSVARMGVEPNSAAADMNPNVEAIEWSLDLLLF